MKDDLRSLPTMHVLVVRAAEQTQSSPQYKWEATIKASDSGGGRVLGYRASGTIAPTGVGFDIVYVRQLQVHDANNPIWTTLVIGERPKVRKKIEDLVRRAVVELEKSGEPKFEKRLPD